MTPPFYLIKVLEWGSYFSLEVICESDTRFLCVHHDSYKYHTPLRFYAYTVKKSLAIFTSPAPSRPRPAGNNLLIVPGQEEFGY